MILGCLQNLVCCKTLKIKLFTPLVSLCASMETQHTLFDCTYKVHSIREVQLTPEMVAYNKSMSRVRVAVEWIFGDIVNYFKFMDFKKNLKIGLSQVGKMYIVAAILRNALTCLYGNETSQFFELDSPSLHEYFS